MGEKHPYEKYRQILLRNRTVVWKVCERYAGRDRDLLKDLVQEVSLAIFLDIGKLREDVAPHKEKAWVRWQCRAAIKKYLLKNRPTFDELNEAVSSRMVLEQSQVEERMEEIMSHLTGDEKEMVQMELDGYNTDETAQKLGISVNTLYQRKHRMIVKLQKIFNVNGEQE